MDVQSAELTIEMGFRDNKGLIVQGDGDGGDTCSRTGLFWYAIRILRFDHRDRDHFLSEYRKLEIKPGILVRHPDEGPNCGKPGYRDFACWNNPKVLSRDQWVPIVIALGAWGRTVELKALFKESRKRFFFHQNGDLTGPSHWGVWIRAFQIQWLKPVLYFTDLFLVLGALIDLVKAQFKPNDTSDVINGTIQLIQANRCQPTVFTRLATWLLSKRGPQGAWDIYFHHHTKAPPFNDLYRSLIKDYF